MPNSRRRLVGIQPRRRIPPRRRCGCLLLRSADEMRRGAPAEQAFTRSFVLSLSSVGVWKSVRVVEGLEIQF